jgi:3-oxoacyl-[acyl-carrier-protein] synthase III
VEERPWLSHGLLSVLGTGRALPGDAVTTDALIDLVSDRFDLSNGRQARAVARHMRIDTRHICRDFNARNESARPGQANPDLAAQAIGAALAEAGLDISDIGYLIGHTTTPLQPLPSNIAVVADRIGYQGPHAEFRQACTGFANGLAMAFGLLARPDARPVVIVGSETGSLFFDPILAATDGGQLVNMVQMGDAAAAIILGPASDRGATLHSAWFGSIGLNRTPGLQMRHGACDFEHDFEGILAHGNLLFEADQRALTAHGHTLGSADIIIPHQVSGRIGEQAAAHFGVSRDRIFVNGGRVGNTGSAAIWLALAELRAGGLTEGAQIVAMGAEATKYMYGGFVYEHA